MNQVASKPAELNQRKPHHYLFAFAVSIVGFLVTLGTVSALKWFGHRPFAGEGQSLGIPRTFGGPALSTLFITARTSLLGIETLTTGWHVHLDGAALIEQSSRTTPGD